ncbi:MAG: YtxH domain-containing protein [Bacteroidota bacterium]
MANTKTTLGFIAGAALGAIAGILLAPDSGAATRRKIADTSRDLADAVKENVSDWLDKLQKGVDEEVKQEGDNTVANMNSGAL